MNIEKREYFASALLLVMGVGAGCAMPIAQPFEGPGYDAEKGVTLNGVGDHVVVGLTNAVVKDGEDRALFNDHVKKVTDSLADQPGFIGHSLRSTLDGSEVWTMTVWRDEDAMWNFVAGQAHATAIGEAYHTLETSRFINVHMPTASVPMTWDDAEIQLDKNGGTYEDASP